MARKKPRADASGKEARSSRPASRPLPGGGAVMLAVFLLSGASGLIYQVVWSRALTLVFGSTSHGVATVLAAFMGGLAIGSAVAARVGDGIKSPLRAYGMLEGGIAVLALGVLILMPVLEVAYKAIYPLVQLSLAGLTFLRFTLASAFLLPATILMGATLPILSAYFERQSRLEGQGASVLYAVNTAGAVAGTAVAGFVLLPAAGMRAATLIAVAVNAVAALGAFWLSRKVETGPESAGRHVRIPFSDARPAGEEGEEPAPAAAGSFPRAAVVAAIGVSGVGALVLEVVWTRSLSLVLGSSTYAFTVMLTTFLIGLAVGSAVAGKMLRRIADPMGAFALVELAAGLAVYAGVILLPELPYLFLELFRSTQDSPGLFSAGRFLLAGCIMLPPTLLLGATFPLAVRCLRIGSRNAAAPVGLLYSVNTLGAIAGSLAAGFALIPVLGLKRTLIIGALINISAAALLIATRPARRPWLKYASVAVMALLMPGFLIGAPQWNPMVMASGIYQYAPRYVDMFSSRREFLEHHDAGVILFYKDGRSATVSVEVRPKPDDGTKRLALAVNGKVDASNHGDMETQILLGQLPLLLAKEAGKVALVGWGSGITAGSALTHEELKSLVAIEIEPAVMEASRYFSEYNNHPREDPRLSVELNDARHFMLVTRDRFDVIISEPSNPWLPGPSRLFTREAFEMMKERLNPGGMLCQWVQLYGLDPDTLRTLLRTLDDVFDDVLVFKASSGDAIVLASDSLIRIDAEQVTSRIGRPGVREDLKRIGISSLAAILARIRIGGSAVQALTGPGPVNTDDNALIEFSATRTLHLLNDFRNETLLATPLWSPLDRIELSGYPEPAARRLDIDLARALLDHKLPHRAQAILKTFSEKHGISPALVAEAQAIQGEILIEAGEESAGVRSWRDALQRDPASATALFDLGKHIYESSSDPETAEKFLRRAVESDPSFAEAKLELARVLHALGRHREALGILTEAAENPPEVLAPFIQAQWGRSCYALGMHACAIEHLTRYFRETPEVPKPAERSIPAAIDLAGAYLATGRTSLAMENFQIAADLARTLTTWNNDQARLAEQQGRFDKMVGYLKMAIYWTPADAVAYQALGGHYMREGKWAEALPVWEDLLLRHPGNKFALRGATQALSHLGRLGEAVPYLRKLIEFETDPSEKARLQAAYDEAVAARPSS